MKASYKLLLAAFLASTALCLHASEGGADRSIVFPAVQTDHPFDRASALLTKISAAGDIAPEQFASVLGADAAQVLTLFGVNRISVAADVVTVTMTKPFSLVSKKGTRTQVATAVTFKLRNDPTGRISCTAISGVRIKSFWFIGWMKLQALNLSLATTGNTTIEALLDTHIGTVKKDSELDADGKPLP